MKAEDNILLTQTAPGTPMGDLFRRYWLPILLTEELPEPDCPPVRVKLLSERLIAFRDSENRLGLIGEFCAHRGVSLWFGRNEEGGIRCPYHGWKYNVKGECVEVPSEPADSGFCSRIKLKSYPLIESGGILWAYLGPPELQPPPPNYEWTHVPSYQRFNTKRLQYNNYLQAMEGGIDSSHVSFLHSGELNSDPLHRSTQGAQFQRDRTPKFEIVESSGGLYIGARRNAGPGEYYWRVTQWMFPMFSMVPPYGDNPLNGHAWVPIDDESCFAWTFTYHPTRPLSEDEMIAMRSGKGIHTQFVPGTFRPLLSKENDYMIDRDAQKAGLYYSGVRGIAMQDASLQESMGELQDRTNENLVSTDNAIIMARHRLKKAALALAKTGETPPGLEPASHFVRSASFVLPVDEAFHEAQREALLAHEGVSHTSI